MSSSKLEAELDQLRQVACLPPSQLGKLKLDRLSALLNHARSNSSLYKDLIPTRVAASSASSCEELLSDMPILSDSKLRAASMDGRIFCSNPARRVTRKTAGTTGAPKTIEIDSKAMARQFAVRAFFLESIGLSLGSRELRLWGRPATNRAALLNGLLNRQVISTDLLWNQYGSDSKRLFEDLSWRYAYGYSSLVLRLAELWVENGAGASPFDAAIYTAEDMSESQCDYVSAAFQCPVFGEYGCTETDILAFGCAYGRYHLVEPNFVFEPIPVPEETDAFEFLVTDLNNFRTPLIRYRLGDRLVGVDFDSSCPCGLPWASFRSVRGRTADRIVRLPSGRVLHASVFAKLMSILEKHDLGYGRFLVEETVPGQFLLTLSGVLNDKQNVVEEVLERAVAAEFGGLPRGCITVRFGDIPQVPGTKFSYFVRGEERI